MRCIDECGYHQKPDNLDTLVRHIEECLAKGACQRLAKDPFVIWKDGGFAVVEKVTKKDRIFPITLIKKEAIELTEDMIKTIAEVKAAQAKGANASMLAPEVGSRASTNRKSKKIKAQLDEGI
jgi:ferredoxin